MTPDRETIYLPLAPLLQSRFGAPLEAMNRLESDDDWSFVIKLHALLESVVSTLLESGVDKRTWPLLADLEIGDVDRGKLKWLTALELMPKEDAEFIRFLSGIRNKVAHDIRQSNFKFDDWVKSLDSSKRKRFLAVISALPGTFKKGEVQIEKSDIIFRRPKFVLLSSAVGIIMRAEFVISSKLPSLDQATPKG